MGIFRALAELDVKVPVTGLVPTSENLADGKSYKPGDVIRAMNGKSVEVLNTDAEGRLILADALSYASSKIKPTHMVDMATLTGAAVTTLGHNQSVVMGNDEPLRAKLYSCGEEIGDRCWPMPLIDEHKKAMQSDIADLKNLGGGGAGSLTAGAFLSAFVDDKIKWCHLDIAGTAWVSGNQALGPKGASGAGVRLLLQWLNGL